MRWVLLWDFLDLHGTSVVACALGWMLMSCVSFRLSCSVDVCETQYISYYSLKQRKRITVIDSIEKIVLIGTFGDRHCYFADSSGLKTGGQIFSAWWRNFGPWNHMAFSENFSRKFRRMYGELYDAQWSLIFLPIPWEICDGESRRRLVTSCLMKLNWEPESRIARQLKQLPWLSLTVIIAERRTVPRRKQLTFVSSVTFDWVTSLVATLSQASGLFGDDLTCGALLNLVFDGCFSKWRNVLCSESHFEQFLALQVLIVCPCVLICANLWVSFGLVRH